MISRAPNGAQRIILAVYIAFVAFVVLYPPFVIEIQGNIVRSEYSFLWDPIIYGTEYGRTPVGILDVPRIVIELIGATLAALAGYLLFSGRET